MKELKDIDFLEILMEKDHMVTKSNVMIEGEYRLTTTQAKVLQAIFSSIQPNEKPGKTFLFSAKRFMELLELKGQSGYSELSRITKELGTPFNVKIKDRVEQVAWLKRTTYYPHQGLVSFQINEFWNEYLYSLNSNFTSYKLFNITNLKSAYSIRLYELLRSRVALGSRRVFTLQELRAKLGISEDIYPLYGNLKKKVLLKAQAELREKSDIYFEFEEIKNGRAVHKIEFHIYANKQAEPLEAQPAEELEVTLMLKEELIALGMDSEEAEELVSSYPEELVRDNVHYTKERQKAGSVAHPHNYVKAAIKNNYAETGLKETGDSSIYVRGSLDAFREFLEMDEEER